MRVHSHDRAQQAQFDQEGRFRARAFKLEKGDFCLLPAKNLLREVRRNPDAALGFIALFLADQAHSLRAEFGHQCSSQEVGVEVFQQHTRTRIGGIAAGASEGNAHEINKYERHHKQPRVPGLAPEKEPDVIVADFKNLFHARAPFASDRWKRVAATNTNTAPTMASLSALTVQTMSPPPNWKPRRLSMNQ